MGKVLRFIGIVMMGLTAAFTLLGGAGTTCVALAAENYDSMAAIAPYKWLYVIFVITTISIGVLMARATVMLVRGRQNGYRAALISLVLGILVGGIHMAVSRSLRGSSMPVDAVTYTAVLTLIVFLLFRLPGVWQQVDFGQAKLADSQKAGGAAAIMAGGLAFSIQHLMAATHTMNSGTNYGDAFHFSMTIAGWVLMLGGLGLVLWPVLQNRIHALGLAWPLKVS
ncbi:MAG: hypothetical protein JW862_06185 [Anaerolineales bacterium]|nr:hypothetical protein [Anaerolineales bacterium]